jgi:branched-chain amino acid transport system permease protein
VSLRPHRLLFALLLVLLLVAAFLAAAVPAFAAGEAVKGRLVARVGEERTPISGVTIDVTQGGTLIGSDVSGNDGTWLVAVPGAGTYSVELDASTLPSDVSPAEGSRLVLPDVEVTEGKEKVVLFPMGEGTASTASTAERAGTLFVAGLKLGAVIALSAVGLSLIYAVTGLVNFAHGEMVTLGAVLAYFFHASPGGPHWPLIMAAIPAILAGAAFGWAQDRGLWRPLRKRGMGLISMMVVSIGLAFTIRHLVLVLFGGQRRLYRDFTGQSPIEVLGIPMVPKHLATIAAAIVILGGVGLFLQRTKMGTALRAVSDDPDLAESSGVNVDRVITLTWVLAGGLASIGGVFFAVNEGVQWDMGLRLLLLIFAAVVLGGLGTAYGAMVGGFVVGVAVEMSTLLVPSELKGAVGLVLLIVILLVRPQGLLGQKGRIG